MLGREERILVYFDQRLGATTSKHWLKSTLSMMFTPKAEKRIEILNKVLCVGLVLEDAKSTSLNPWTYILGSSNIELTLVVFIKRENVGVRNRRGCF